MKISYRQLVDWKACQTQLDLVKANFGDGEIPLTENNFIQAALIGYAVAKGISKRDRERNDINLVITCVDLIGDNYYLLDGEDILYYRSEEAFIAKIANAVNATNVYITDSPEKHFKQVF